QPAAIRLRTVSSGQQVDYVASGKYIPDGISPSNDLFIRMLEAKGTDVQVISDSLVENYAGIVMPKKVYNDIKETYNGVDVKTIAQAVSDEMIVMGYTNPFTSAAGMNFLVTLLDSYDSGSILSEKATAGFSSFQTKIPFVSMTTGQMRNAAERGTFDAFVSEYQTYLSDANLSQKYEFVPYGYRHNNPLVAVSGDANKQAILESFAAFCKENGAKLAEQDGFNRVPDGYMEMATEYKGDDLIAAQKLYKENKDPVPIVCVFVADVSGSMDGESLNMLKDSLINSMQYINTDNYIGLVSYSDDVTIELPIEKFDMNQQSLFKGTVENLWATGGTATFDAVCVALDMIEKQMETVPEAKPIVFVLSDGETNRGYSLQEIEGVVSGLKVPVYTICYNGDIAAMEELSGINEGVNINANTEDVTYQLRQLFNASM
ncbi:MAG: VWA domain-containing protein, partial [Lachnospiraceae bacterium]|nr:VWA domain-containing protein [Lachnospiraceae bacterium]